MTQTEPSSQQRQLEQAIAAQESLRGTVDDTIIDAAIVALKAQLAALEPPTEQHRKQVTLLFMDVVGSTSIVHNLDPEDSLAILDTALKRLTTPIEEYGGQVTRYMGDGFMSVFGHPVVYENDPDRAVLAGLAILKVAEEYAKEVERQWGIRGFNVRVGINTGLVVIGGQSEAEDTIMGAAVNLAARLESAAEPGTLLISHNTYQHVRGAFDLETLEPITAKGFAEPVHVYRVLRAKGRSFRTRRRGVEGVETRMVGRKSEFHHLQRTFKEVLDEGERLMVTLIGEAGIGKSRMLYEFENWVDLQSKDVTLYRGRARQETQHQPYGLLRDIFAFRFEIKDDDPIQLVREKVVNGFQETLGTGESTEMKAHFCGQLLGYDFQESSYLAKIQDARQIRDRALVYMTDYFKAAASEEPVLVLLEDLHWADDSSLDMLALLALALREKPVMVLGAARPGLYERRPGWMEGQLFYSRLDLQPLSGDRSRRLVEEVLQKVDDVPDALKELVVSKTEGNPFYVEELVKMLVEDGVILKGEERWQVHPERLGEVQVPPTLTGILQARLEALPETEQSVLQRASVVGRVFWDMVLTYLDRSSQAGVGEDAVLKALELLCEKEIIYRQEPSAFDGAIEHIFKHALLREVTYESVLKRLRRDYHGLVADWLIEQSGERLGEFTGLIADHLESAGRKADALTYLQKAGEAAAGYFANEEAVDYFTRALALVQEEDLETNFELLLAREKILGLRGQRTAQAADLEAMGQLASSLGEVEKEAETALQQANYYYDIGDFSGAVESSQRGLELVGQAGNLEQATRGNRIWGLALTQLGEYIEAKLQLEEALTLARKAVDRRSEASVLNNLGPVVSALGEYPQAQEYYEQGLALARQTGDRYVEGAALNNLGNVSLRLGNYPEAREFYEHARMIAHEIGDRVGEEIVLINLGVISADLGKFEQAQAYYDQGLTLAKDIGDRRGERISLSNLGGVAQLTGDSNKAHGYYKQALVLAREIEDRHGEGFVLDGLCDALVSLNKLEKAAEVGQQAVDLREEIGQQQLAIESRATLALAKQTCGHLPDALREVETILAYLDTGGSLDGTSDPFRIYLTCFQVLQANEDLRAMEVLETAYTLLNARAKKIRDEDLRRSFLENVPWHREIVQLWEARE